MSNIFSKNQDGFSGRNISGKCFICGKKIDAAAAKIIGKKNDNAVFLLVECPECKGAAILSIINDIFGTVSFSMITDMAMDDIERFKGREDMSYDEILDIYVSSKNRRKVKEKAGR